MGATQKNGVGQEQPPPQNPEAERWLLSACFRANEVIPQVRLVVRPWNFHADAHRKIFACMEDLNEKGIGVDFVSVTTFLKEHGQIADAGGHAYVAELWNLEVTKWNVEHYAALVREASLLCSVIQVCNEAARDAYDPKGSAQELVGRLEGEVLALSQMGVTGECYSMSELMRETDDVIDAIATGQAAQGIPTGFTDMDDQTGGVHNSEFTLLAGRPSTGKTALALAQARNIAVDKGLPVFFISLEQSRVEIGLRLLCMQGRVDLHRLRKNLLNAEERQRLIEARDILAKSPIFVDDTPRQTMSRIMANVRRMKLRHGIRFVILDYLQLIEADNPKQNRQEQVAEISRRLKLLAREVELPVLALTQLNRNAEGRADGHPRLADLRESGAQEQDADAVVLMWRVERKDEIDVIGVDVAKQRNGPTGEFQMAFRRQCVKFENLAADAVALERNPFRRSGD